MQYILIGNFGNHSLAALQYLIDHGLSPIHFVYVNTGWAAFDWQERLDKGFAYAQAQGVQIHALQAQVSFSDLVKDRKQFPSQKFQWCAGFLKGLAINDFLDKQDPLCEAMIISGKYQFHAKLPEQLKEYQENDDSFQGRRVWHPLWQHTDAEVQALIKKTGLSVLNHPSKECSPCIHDDTTTHLKLHPQDTKRLEKLEQTISQTMFSKCGPCAKSSSVKGISFDRGCGARWHCGE